jgi:hypothetical protein
MKEFGNMRKKQPPVKTEEGAIVVCPDLMEEYAFYPIKWQGKLMLYQRVGTQILVFDKLP